MWKVAMAVGAVVATTAIAQAPSDRTTRVTPNGDINQVVCINERVTGSRVATQRVCRTRAEWADLEAQTRRSVEKTQFFKPTCEPKGRC